MVRNSPDEDTRRARLQEWLSQPDESSFAAEWSAAAPVLLSDPDLCSWFTHVIRSKSPVVSEAFRGLASRHLAGLVDAHFEEYWSLGASSVGWQVLYALGPATRADWLCVLGDLAANRGDDAQAARRYELADRFGCSHASGRLKQLVELSAYRSLLRGDVAGAARPGRLGGSREYRDLLRAAVALIRGEPAGDQVAQLSRTEPSNGIYPAAMFVTALVKLRDGNRPAAREKLSALLAAPVRSATDHDLAANARVLLGLLDQDDKAVAAGAGALLDRHQERWPARLMADPQAVLTAVSRDNPALLLKLVDATPDGPGRSGLGVELVASCVRAAREALVNAARMALLGRVKEAEELLARARYLLDRLTGPDAEQLADRAVRIGEIAARIASTPLDERRLSRLGYAALRVDGVVFPWTPQAEQVWETALARAQTDSRILHHLAIAHHARAYQLELDGDAMAFAHWQKGLGYWDRLHADNAFWDSTRRHLAGVMPDADPAEIARAVEEARGGLPASLLDPHQTLVVRLKTTQAERAKAHMNLILGAPFPGAVARSRRALTRAAGNKVRGLARQGRFDLALDEAESWLGIDAGNIHVAEQALGVGTGAAEAAREAGGDDWAQRALPVLDRVQTLVDPLRSYLGVIADGSPSPARKPSPADCSAEDRAEFIAKLARHEFWQGLCGLAALSSRDGEIPNRELRNQVKVAVKHLILAINLKLPPIAPYSQATELLAIAQRFERDLQGHRVMGFW
jgi:hypothetical protein